MKPFRKTTQHLAPVTHTPAPEGQYDIYPGFEIGPNKIWVGHEALANKLIELSQQHHTRNLIIDGYGGVLWTHLRESLTQVFTVQDVGVRWFNIDEALRPTDEIERLVAPFLGGDDPIFGTAFTGSLRNFFSNDALAAIQPDNGVALNIVYGTGAALCGWDAPLIYVDVPKNEIQFRARAKSIGNLGWRGEPLDPKPAYKRCYFVDWPALNQHKAQLLPKVDLIVDGQRPDEPTFMRGDDLRTALQTQSQNYFRVRPWFEPGPWGGQWIKPRMPQLAQDAPNYAWSFELIVPENGLFFESDQRLLEVSFDWLMFYDHQAVLGKAAQRFGQEFPIRFDFLDTFDGGNLSVQCHPRPEYIRKHFGERFTQDETYYILDCGDDAEVFLGFHEGVDPTDFRAALERSFKEAKPLDVDHFVQRFSAHKHDLFLIPNGTIHCSGKNNIVLEISATPYIFTFKMYDWMRMDLDGKPRPLNIARAFDNLYFERQGQRAIDELISQPQVIAHGDGWQTVHVPTHPAHFYDVHRHEFDGAVEIENNGQCHVLSLVEGTSIRLETTHGLSKVFHYAETFVIPAATERYRLINLGNQRAKVVKAFVKDEGTKG